MAKRKSIFEPTPKQIKAACLEIQEVWSEQERRRRHVATRSKVEPYEVPEVDTSTFSSAAPRDFKGKVFNVGLDTR